jgi:diguanylate cyclase (GGDEF)-like protein
MPGKAKLLKQVPMFSELSQRALDTVARYSRYYKYGIGKVIFDDNSRGEELFIIKSGEVLITKHHGEGDRDIARFIAGETFGDLELFDEASRSTVATAVTETMLLQFPGKGFLLEDLLRRHARIFAPVLHNLLVIIARRIRDTNKLISENAPWVQDLRRQLHTDKLTGLYNRTYLEEDFSELLSRYGEGTALMMVKPDRFKRINDRFGHETGDRVLRVMAQTLLDAAGSEGLAARYRGDEFAVIIPDAGIERSRNLARDIGRAIGSIDMRKLVGEAYEPITVSTGVALYSRDGKTNMELIQSTFELMFMAREAGGNCVLCAGDAVEVR